MGCLPGSHFPCGGNVYQALEASWDPFCRYIPFIPSLFPLPWPLHKAVLTLGFCIKPSCPAWLVGTGFRLCPLLSSHISILSFSACYSHLWAHCAHESLCWSHTLCWLSNSHVFESQSAQFTWERYSAPSGRKCWYSYFQLERHWGLPLWDRFTPCGWVPGLTDSQMMVNIISYYCTLCLCRSSGECKYPFCIQWGQWSISVIIYRLSLTVICINILSLSIDSLLNN